MGDNVTKLPTIREAAELAGIPPYTLKRRLLALHERTGRVLVSFARPGSKVRKWHVRPEGLLLAMREDPTATDEHLHQLEHKLSEFEARLVALRNAFRQHKRSDAAWKKEQDAINVRNGRIIRELAGIDSSIVKQRRTTSNTPA